MANGRNDPCRVKEEYPFAFANRCSSPAANKGRFLAPCSSVAVWLTESSLLCRSGIYHGQPLGTDNQEKDEKQSQNDKTGLGIEKTVKDKKSYDDRTSEHNEPANYKAALSNPESEKWLAAMNVEMQSIKDNQVYIRTIRILIAIAAFYDYEIWKIDVKISFLGGHLSEEVYMVQPEGFVTLKHPNQVCELKRFIYGLKQASRQWNKRFDDEIKKFCFTQKRNEPYVYMKASVSNVTFLILYVDDILIMGNYILMLQDVKSYLGKCFAMKDLGEAAYVLGIKIYKDRSRRLIGLCQSAYIEKILKRFNMETSKRGSIPMQDKLKLNKSQGASTPNEVKRMQRVLYASAVDSIMYALRVACYTDVGYLTDIDDTKSHIGYVFVLNEGVIDWKSTKQTILATSSTESEYIVASNASKEAVWIRKLIYGLGIVPTNEKPMMMYCDNTGAITIANEPGITKGAKHYCTKV
ncbi:retrotransposon protein, putative, ty1-copia subclass [Tanacetum coccineum]